MNVFLPRPARRTVVFPLLVLGCGTLGCGLDLPVPPDLKPLNDQYEAPTVIFDSERAGELLAPYVQQREGLA